MKASRVYLRSVTTISKSNFSMQLLNRKKILIVLILFSDIVQTHQ